jgi:hypothetical protein
MSRLGSADPVLPARNVVEILYHPSPKSKVALFRASHSDAVPRLPHVSWQSFSGPHTSILSSYWSYDLVHQFHPVQDWPIVTESYPLFPIYTGLPTGKLGLPLACSLLWTILRPWRWRRYVPPKRRVQLYGLHGVISRKMILFKTTAAKTSNPTRLYIIFALSTPTILSITESLLYRYDQIQLSHN